MKYLFTIALVSLTTETRTCLLRTNSRNKDQESEENELHVELKGRGDKKWRGNELHRNEIGTGQK